MSAACTAALISGVTSKPSTSSVGRRQRNRSTSMTFPPGNCAMACCMGSAYVTSRAGRYPTLLTNEYIALDRGFLSLVMESALDPHYGIGRGFPAGRLEARTICACWHEETRG